MGPDGAGEGARMVGRAILAAGLLALTACGLEILPDLDPPGDPVEALPGTPTFYVLNQATLIPEFRGFEIYYKFFSSDQSTDQANQSGLQSREELLSAGFFRMYAPGPPSDAPPLIWADTADRNTSFPVVLNFNVVESAAPSADYQGANPPTVNPIPIHRAATDTIGETKTFEQVDLAPTDSDLTGVTWPEAGQSQALNLVVYAISFGLQDLSTRLYSTPRYLGYMDYNFF